MIKSFSLKNFQSHKSTLITLDPGVNVIIGKSDSGKSSIARGIRMLVDNRPSGDEFISNWGGPMELVMITDDGAVITRTKDKSYNAYHLMKQEFVAFKTDVPEEIRRALNIGAINLQHQFAGPFLLAEETSPGEVAKHFNRVAKLDKIDEGVKNINSAIRQIDQNIKAYGMNIESSEKKLEDYTHLEKFEIEVEALEQLGKQYNTKSANVSELGALIEEIKSIDTDIADWGVFLEMDDEVTKILDLISKRNALERGPIAEIAGVLHEIESIDADLGDWNHSLKKWEKRFKEEFPEVCPLCNTNLKK